MKKYTFIMTPWSVRNKEYLKDVFNQTLAYSAWGVSLKDALQQLYKSLEFDKYIHTNSTVWVYWKSYFNGKLFSIPEYEDVDIQ